MAAPAAGGLPTTCVHGTFHYRASLSPNNFNTQELASEDEWQTYGEVDKTARLVRASGLQQQDLVLIFGIHTGRAGLFAGEIVGGNHIGYVTPADNLLFQADRNHQTKFNIRPGFTSSVNISLEDSRVRLRQQLQQAHFQVTVIIAENCIHTSETADQSKVLAALLEIAPRVVFDCYQNSLVPNKPTELTTACVRDFEPPENLWPKEEDGTRDLERRKSLAQLPMDHRLDVRRNWAFVTPYEFNAYKEELSNVIEEIQPWAIKEDMIIPAFHLTDSKADKNVDSVSTAWSFTRAAKRAADRERDAESRAAYIHSNTSGCHQYLGLGHIVLLKQ